ncbi:hypothetical protein BU16DRAFT_615734 [Lophium mytilinum]|uniref:Uncharacterized protein n=1 Tax=Lophium mytilinum TaxID=390894 RepID=A0A6A6R1Z2_9PEZI|nr:hypothetical protein BU16DRAFT_615734 [Lophium mytilinum]
MAEPFAEALRKATTNCESGWIDERHDIPTIAPEDRIRFLSAELSNRINDKERLQDDRLDRRALYTGVMRLFDEKEILVERWPAKARLILTQVADSASTQPFETHYENLTRQRRRNAVWASLLCFLVYAWENEEACLREMGLELSDEHADDIMDIQQALLMEGFPVTMEKKHGMVEAAIENFFHGLVREERPSGRGNPLLWWITIPVRSAVEEGGDDYISRGVFRENVLPMDLDVRTRLEAIVHYAKVLELYVAFGKWQPNPERYLSVEKDLNAVDCTWIGQHGGPRPERALEDETKYDSEAWKDVLSHLEKEFDIAMGNCRTTTVPEIAKLLR